MGRVDNDIFVTSEYIDAVGELPSFLRKSTRKSQLVGFFFFLAFLGTVVFLLWVPRVENIDFFGDGMTISNYISEVNKLGCLVPGLICAAVGILLIIYLVVLNKMDESAYKKAVIRADRRRKDEKDRIYEELEEEENSVTDELEQKPLRESAPSIADSAMHSEDPLRTSLIQKNIIGDPNKPAYVPTPGPAPETVPSILRTAAPKNDDVAVTAENLDEIIAQGPPPPNYINPYAPTDLKGVLKSTGKQMPDEVDLYEPEDTDIQIFKKP